MAPYIVTCRDYRRLQRRARSAQQRDQTEVCGVLIGRGARILSLRFLRNVAERPGAFEVRLGDIRAVRGNLARRERIAGLFHSYPVSEANMGPRDIRATPANWLHQAPGNVLLPMKATGLPKDSVAKASQIVAVDRSFLSERRSGLLKSRMASTWCLADEPADMGIHGHAPDGLART